VSEPAWLVAGLGNPGSRYARTRHNLGYRVADELAAHAGAAWRIHRDRRAQVAIGRVTSGAQPLRVVLVKPLSFMNDSGGPVATIASYYGIPLDRLVVVHDELDLELGTVRLKLGGGDGGHNGVRSVRRSLGSGDFYRVRVGIGRPPGGRDAADFVLSEFATQERDEAAIAVSAAGDAVLGLLLEGIGPTQSRFHRPAPAPDKSL
jgi:PTH1 family peptidyl-tRNA hydrolase